MAKTLGPGPHPFRHVAVGASSTVQQFKHALLLPLGRPGMFVHLEVLSLDSTGWINESVPTPWYRQTGTAMYQRSHHDQSDKPASRTKWILAGFLAIALFFLLTEHRAHLFGVLPYLLLMACPIMHLFHGHGHHRHGTPGPDPDRSRIDQEPPDSGRMP